MNEKTAPKKEKYVTIPLFEKAMRTIARSFGRIEEKLSNHDKAFDTMFKMMDRYSEEAKEHRLTMESLQASDIKQERAIDALNNKVGIITIK